MMTKYSHGRITYQHIRLAETATYFGIAAASIGQVFFAPIPIHLGNALLVLFGIIFTALAIFSITPIANLLHLSSTTPSSKVVDFESTTTETNRPLPDPKPRQAA